MAPRDAKTPRVSTRSVVAGAIGNMLEWYDFAVFGFFAAAIGSRFSRVRIVLPVS